MECLGRSQLKIPVKADEDSVKGGNGHSTCRTWNETSVEDFAVDRSFWETIVNIVVFRSFLLSFSL